MNWGRFKPLFSDAVISHLQPIQVRSGRLVSLLPCMLQGCSIVVYVHFSVEGMLWLDAIIEAC